MGKLTISIAIFNSYVTNYQRVTHRFAGYLNAMMIPRMEDHTHGSGSVFGWISPLFRQTILAWCNFFIARSFLVGGFKHGFYFPFHIWDVILPIAFPLTNIFQDGWNHQPVLFKKAIFPFGYGSIPINTIFRGMNIQLPAILMFTRGTRFWHTAIGGFSWLCHQVFMSASIAAWPPNSLQEGDGRGAQGGKRHHFLPVIQSMGDLQDPIHGGTLVPYKVLYRIFGHMNCGDIPWKIGLKFIGLKNRWYIGTSNFSRFLLHGHWSSLKWSRWWHRLLGPSNAWWFRKDRNSISDSVGTGIKEGTFEIERCSCPFLGTLRSAGEALIEDDLHWWSSHDLMRSMGKPSRYYRGCSHGFCPMTWKEFGSESPSADFGNVRVSTLQNWEVFLTLLAGPTWHERSWMSCLIVRSPQEFFITTTHIK